MPRTIRMAWLLLGCCIIGFHALGLYLSFHHGVATRMAVGYVDLDSLEEARRSGQLHVLLGESSFLAIMMTFCLGVLQGTGCLLAGLLEGPIGRRLLVGLVGAAMLVTGIYEMLFAVPLGSLAGIVLGLLQSLTGAAALLRHPVARGGGLLYGAIRLLLSFVMWPYLAILASSGWLAWLEAFSFVMWPWAIVLFFAQQWVGDVLLKEPTEPTLEETL